MANWIPNEDVSAIVIPSSAVDIDKSSNGLLGRGGYGCVYSAMFEGQKVAVKMLISDGDIPSNERHSLKKEAQRLRAASQHPNIINLLGVMMETNNYSLILEYMHFGTSSSFIKNFDVGVPLRVQFVKQIISAMAWLHSQKPSVKHLDLKAENVLINNYFNAKISDFGLSEWRTVTMSYSKTPIDRGPRCGTVTHVPPEVFRDINQKGKVEEDVYAFAITAWEIFTGDVPFKGCLNIVDLIRSAVLSNQRPDLSVIVHQCPKLIVDMIRLSWDEQPRNRPTFKEMEEKINPVYLALQHTIPDSIQYIRQEILSEYGETHEKYEYTKHFDNPDSPVKMDGTATNDVPVTSEAGPQVNGQVAEVMDNIPRELDAETCSPTQTNAESIERLNELSLNTPDPPATQQSTIAVVNSERVEQMSGASRNIGVVHVPINETGQNRADIVDSTSGTEHSEIGLSGFVSVKDKQYVSGCEMRHPHGPIAQPASALLEEQTFNEHLGQNTRAELNDVVGAEAVNMFVTNLSTTNPELMQDLVQNPEALQNVINLLQSTAGTEDQLVMNPRPSELTQPLTGTNLRPANTSIRDIIQRNDSNIGSVSVDQLSAPTLNISKQTAVPVPAGQQVMGSSQAEDTVRMLPASHQTHPGSQHSNTLVVHGNCEIAAPVVGLDQQYQQSVIIGQPAQMAGASQQPRFITPNVPQTASMQTAMPNVRPQANQQPFIKHNVPQTASMQTAMPNVRPQADQQPFITPNVPETASMQTAMPNVRPQTHQHPFPASQTIFGQRVRSQYPVQTQRYMQPAVGAAGQVPATIFGQSTRSNLGTSRLGLGSIQPSVAGQQQTTLTRQMANTSLFGQPVPFYQQTSQVLNPSQRQQQTGNHQLAQSPSLEVSQQQGQARSPVHVQPSAATSNSQTYSRPAATQENTCPRVPSATGARQQTAPSDPAGTQNQPFTISHKHVGGGFTTLTMNPDMDFPPNVQIGNNNYMVVHDNKRQQAKKKLKYRKSQLTTCTDELSMDHMDMVSVEIGKDWKRLCRELDMTEADIEQLQFDYHVSGLYEIMYQGIQRWVQRNGRVANVHKMALALWEIDRDDIALRLN